MRRSCRARSSCGIGIVSSTRSRIASGVDALGERLVAEHEPVAEHVLGELADVLGEGVAAAAQERERARAEDEVDRPARAGAVLDVAVELLEPVSASRRVAVAIASA